jgi:transmembrane sensor
MDTIRRRHRASREAADWWAVLSSDEVSRAEREQFVEWLRESPVHVTEMLHILRVHGALGQFDEWSSLPADAAADEDTTVVQISEALPQPRSGWRRLRWLSSIAAGVLLLLVGGWLLLPALWGQVISTERGERRELVLEDGSIVQVDPQTRLRVRFDDQGRNVWLTRGRALFRVAKNPERPFVVRTDRAAVRALGTAFGVERRDRDRIIVTVVEGKVAVAGESARPDEEVLLTANQQITMSGESTEVPVRSVDSKEALAWAEGRLIFRDETVANVVSEFNRYNRVQIRVLDAELAARRVSGVFDAAYPEEFIAFIEGTTPVEIERAEGRTITISPRSSQAVD